MRHNRLHLAPRTHPYRDLCHPKFRDRGRYCPGWDGLDQGWWVAWAFGFQGLYRSISSIHVRRSMWLRWQPDAGPPVLDIQQISQQDCPEKCAADAQIDWKEGEVEARHDDWIWRRYEVRAVAKNCWLYTVAVAEKIKVRWLSQHTTKLVFLNECYGHWKEPGQPSKRKEKYAQKA